MGAVFLMKLMMCTAMWNTWKVRQARIQSALQNLKIDWRFQCGKAKKQEILCKISFGCFESEENC